MGRTIQINTSRMQCIGAYMAKPEGTPKGGIVVVQEIFGLNAWVRSVVERFAAAGYTAIAPAFFDHEHRFAQFGRLDRRAAPCGAAADHDKVEMRHGSPPR